MSRKNGNPNTPYNIIRYKGDLNKAETLDGFTVYRRERLFVPELGREITCAPYDNHFIYEEPTHTPGRPSYMCTCGSAAIVAGLSAYENQQSPSGYMFLCLYHATYGNHTTGESKWI
jgi:hypothetical protein